MTKKKRKKKAKKGTKVEAASALIALGRLVAAALEAHFSAKDSCTCIKCGGDGILTGHGGRQCEDCGRVWRA